MPRLDKNALGDVAENLVLNRLMSMRGRMAPLFRPIHLGAKFPSVDLYVEVTGSTSKRPFFFVQVKGTRARDRARPVFRVESGKIKKLLEYSAPTYLAFVEEGAERIYLKSVHTSGSRTVYHAKRRYLLNEENLVRLRDEVRDFWHKKTKPNSSHFHDLTTW